MTAETVEIAHPDYSEHVLHMPGRKPRLIVGRKLAHATHTRMGRPEVAGDLYEIEGGYVLHTTWTEPQDRYASSASRVTAGPHARVEGFEDREAIAEKLETAGDVEPLKTMVRELASRDESWQDVARRTYLRLTPDVDDTSDDLHILEVAWARDIMYRGKQIASVELPVDREWRQGRQGTTQAFAHVWKLTNGAGYLMYGRKVDDSDHAEVIWTKGADTAEALMSQVLDASSYEWRGQYSNSYGPKPQPIDATHQQMIDALVTSDPAAFKPIVFEPVEIPHRPTPEEIEAQRRAEEEQRQLQERAREEHERLDREWREERRRELEAERKAEAERQAEWDRQETERRKKEQEEARKRREAEEAAARARAQRREKLTRWINAGLQTDEADSPLTVLPGLFASLELLRMDLEDRGQTVVNNYYGEEYA